MIHLLYFVREGWFLRHMDNSTYLIHYRRFLDVLIRRFFSVISFSRKSIVLLSWFIVSKILFLKESMLSPIISRSIATGISSMELIFLPQQST